MKEEMEIGITCCGCPVPVLDLGIEIIEEKPEEPAAAEESADVPPDAAVVPHPAIGSPVPARGRGGSGQ